MKFKGNGGCLKLQLRFSAKKVERFFVYKTDKTNSKIKSFWNK